MNSDQILKVLLSDLLVRRVPSVKVLACDQLPDHINPTKTAAFVINTDPISLPGEHWVALFYNGLGRFYYMDSYGLPPLNDYIVTFIKAHSTRPYVYNPRALQHIINSTCGLYCIYFVLIKARGGTMKHFHTPFTGTYHQYVNDMIIQRLTRPVVRMANVVVSF